MSESNLVRHAKEELTRAGLFSKDEDYGGMTGEFVLKMVKAWSKGGHSGFSHHKCLQIFNRVINFKTLTPITDDPAEWVDVGKQMGMNRPFWQNRRQYSVFSSDGGKTYYDLDGELPQAKAWWLLRTNYLKSGWVLTPRTEAEYI